MTQDSFVKNELGRLQETVRRVEKENTRLAEECDKYRKRLLDRNREIELLQELGEVIVSELDLNKVLRLVADKARELIRAETLLVPIINEEGDRYTYLTASGKYAADIVGTDFAIHVGMCGWVLGHEKPLMFGESDKWWMNEKSPWEEGAKSALLVPLFGKKKIIGGLSGLGKKGGGSFAQQDLDLLTLFANQVSIAIENAKLFQEIRRLVDNLEHRVDDRTTELAAANKELEAFTYSVSHDLRSPLRGVDGFSRALLEEYEDKLDDTGKDYLRRVRAAAQRMGKLIDDLLILSRVTHSKIGRERVDLSFHAQEIAAKLKETQPERRVKFVITEGLVTKGDAALLRMVLENLLCNAWKFTDKHESARIEFGVTQVENIPTYFVRDDGAGFDMAYADKLFDAFQRLHKADEFEGTGIGLATVRRIIHRHGGRVWGDGEVEQGATFYFTVGCQRNSYHQEEL